MNDKIARFLARERPQTPCLVVDLDIVAERYHALREAMPEARVFYAVKANPAPEILSLLTRLGAFFDCASVPEIEMAMAAGADASRISYGNTIKKERDIARAFDLGIRAYAFDSEGELEKLVRAAPGSRVFCRILTTGDGAQWPLSRKFGCDPDMATALLRSAAQAGMMAWGVSFHVGSQQEDPAQWDQPIATAASICNTLEADGIVLSMINLGGGFPSRYLHDVPDACVYGQKIHDSLVRHFGNKIPASIIVEPGRSLVGDAGVIQSEVVLISRKSGDDARRWVYLDIGRFGGLVETMDEAILYPVVSSRTGRGESVILAGPTCDSVDVLYEKADYRLPADLAVGDKVEIHSTGAYTTTYSSVSFNGFPPLGEYYI